MERRGGAQRGRQSGVVEDDDKKKKITSKKKENLLVSHCNRVTGLKYCLCLFICLSTPKNQRAGRRTDKRKERTERNILAGTDAKKYLRIIQMKDRKKERNGERKKWRKKEMEKERNGERKKWRN